MISSVSTLVRVPLHMHTTWKERQDARHSINGIAAVAKLLAHNCNSLSGAPRPAIVSLSLYCVAAEAAPSTLWRHNATSFDYMKLLTACQHCDQHYPLHDLFPMTFPACTYSGCMHYKSGNPSWSGQGSKSPPIQAKLAFIVGICGIEGITAPKTHISLTCMRKRVCVAQ